MATSDEHGDNREDLLGVRVRRHVAEADARQTRAREVERRDVGAVRERRMHRLVVDRPVKLLRQLVQPACDKITQ